MLNMNKVITEMYINDCLYYIHDCSILWRHAAALLWTALSAVTNTIGMNFFNWSFLKINKF
mgnify:CR=1 FL=1